MQTGILRQPWAIERSTFSELERSLLAAGSDPAMYLRARESQPASRRAQSYQVTGNVAVIPIKGVLVSNPSIFDLIFGATAMGAVEQNLRSARLDASVKAIILDIDSPGGTVAGTQELAQLVRDTSDKKQIVAYGNGTAASAAYWIAAAADTFFLSSDTSRVGSIGIIAAHVDISEREKMMGIKTSEVYAGKYKAIKSQHAPLSTDGREAFQAEVDYLYSVFVNNVAEFRGVTTNQVIERMADGRIFYGRDAVGAGLADGIKSFDALLTELSGGQVGRRRPETAALPGASMAIQSAPGSFEDQCRVIWGIDEAVRAEFLSFDNYHAFARGVSGPRYPRKG